MFVGRVFDRDELGCRHVKAQFRDRRVTVGEEPLPKGGVRPGFRHDKRAVRGGDGVAMLDLAADLVGGHDALLNQQFLQGDAEDLIVGVHLVVGLRRRVRVSVIMVMIVVVMFVIMAAHDVFSSQCS